MTHTSIVRGAATCLSVLLMLPTLMIAAGPAPMGSVRCVGTVYVGSAKVPFDAALFSGDRVVTKDGRATLSLSYGSRLQFDRDTIGSLSRSAAGFTLGLEKGRVTFNSAPQSPIQVATGGLLLAPEGKFPSLADVAMLSGGSLSVSVHRGAVVVRNLGSEPVVVRAGTSISINPPLAADGTKNPGTAAHGGKTVGQAVKGFKIGSLSHGASVAVVGSLVAAAALGVSIPLALDDKPASPSSPSP